MLFTNYFSVVALQHKIYQFIDKYSVVLKQFQNLKFISNLQNTKAIQQ